MPRKSAASLVVLTPTPGKRGRLVPRQGMPEAVREVFIELVASVPVEHFRAADAALIEQYGQAILLARRAYEELAAEGPLTADGKCSAWNVVLEKAHRSSAALAGRLRLAPQMREQSRTAGRQKDASSSFYETLEQGD